MTDLPKNLREKLEELKEVSDLLESPEYGIKETLSDHAVEGTRDNLLSLQKQLKVKIKKLCKNHDIDYEKLMSAELRNEKF